MKTALLTLLAAASVARAGAPAAPAAPAAPKPAASSALKTEEQRVLYTLGAILAARSPVPTLSLSADEMKYVSMGWRDAALNKKLQADVQGHIAKTQEWVDKRMAAKAAKEKEKGAAFLAAAAKEPGAQKTESGLIFTEIKAGAGEAPAAADSVKASYEGKLVDGTVFDASARHGGPIDFELNRVIKCWTEGIQKMKVGGKARLVCPPEIAYGDQPPPGIPVGATLIFDVDLVGINKK